MTDALVHLAFDSQDLVRSIRLRHDPVRHPDRYVRELMRSLRRTAEPLAPPPRGGSTRP